MSFDSLLNESATLRRLAGTTDRYGNVIRDFDTEATIKVRLDYQSASESEDDAESTNTSARIYTRYLDINAFDELIIDGITWRVVGEPILRHTASSAHHLEINAEKVTA